MNNTCILCPQFFDWYSIREKVSNSIFIFRAISLTSVGKPPCFLHFLPCLHMASWIFLFHWNFDFSSNHSIISIPQFEFLPEKFFVCVNSYLPWNYFNVSIFRWSLCHFYEIIVCCCFFSDLNFPPKNSGENIRSASGFFIADIPFVKNPGLSFLHFRLIWCSLT
jgi:hypothetical protein